MRIKTGATVCVFLSERITQGKQTSTAARSRTITYSTSFLTQFRWVLKRTLRNLMLNPQTSIAQVRTDAMKERSCQNNVDLDSLLKTD